MKTGLSSRFTGFPVPPAVARPRRHHLSMALDETRTENPGQSTQFRAHVCSGFAEDKSRVNCVDCPSGFHRRARSGRSTSGQSSASFSLKARVYEGVSIPYPSCGHSFAREITGSESASAAACRIRGGFGEAVAAIRGSSVFWEPRLSGRQSGDWKCKAGTADPIRFRCSAVSGFRRSGLDA